MSPNQSDSAGVEKLNYLTPKEVKQIQTNYKTPVFVYDQKSAETNADNFLNFPNAY